MFFGGADAYSKWPEVRVMSSTTTSQTLDVLREWFASCGLPEHIVTDNGPQFVSEAFETFMTSHTFHPPHATTGVQPCKLMVQRDMRTRFNFLIPNCARSVLDKQSQQKSAHDYVSHTRAGQSHGSTGVNWVPGIIAEVLGPITYLVDTDEGQC